MKKARLISACCIAVITSVFSLVIFEAFDKQKYEFFYERSKEFSVNLNVIVPTQARLDEIAKIAQANDVIFFHKTHEMRDFEQVTVYFLPQIFYEDQAARMGVDAQFESLSTRAQSGEGVIKDFLNNDAFVYKKMDVAAIQRTTNVTIAAKNDQDFNEFLSELVSVYPQGHQLVLSSQATLSIAFFQAMVGLAISTLLILLVIDVFIATYYFMARAKEIGIMMMIGKRKRAIFSQLYFVSRMVEGGVVVLIVIASYTLIVNVSKRYMLMLFLMYGSLFVVKLLVNYLAFLGLLAHKTRQDLIKEKSFTKTAYVITQSLKACVGALCLIITTLAYHETSTILSLKHEFSKHVEIDDWTLIPTFLPDTHFFALPYQKVARVHNRMYERLAQSFSIFYVHRCPMIVDEFACLNVDLNYLKRHDFPIADYDFKQPIILLPKSLTLTKAALETHFESQLQAGYHFEYYEQATFNPYAFYQKNLTVTDPILVLHSINVPIVQEVFGAGLQTGLKIKGTPEAVFNTLKPLFEEMGISQTFERDSFATLAQTKQNVLNFNAYTLYFVLILVLITGVVEIILIDNGVRQFMSKYRKELAVRSLLGHDAVVFMNRHLHRSWWIELALALITFWGYTIIVRTFDLGLFLVLTTGPHIAYLYARLIHALRHQHETQIFLKGEEV